MDVAIAGGHGKVALHTGRLLAARGDRARGLIRDESHSEDLLAVGAQPVLCDLERVTSGELAGRIRGADAAVFAAGAGPGSGAARKEAVDYGGAATLLEAAKLAGVDRYVIVSAMGAREPPAGDDVFSVYLRAKARADQELMASDRAWTVLRPGTLTDDAPTGRVRLGRQVQRGRVPRGDVAAVILAVLDDDRTAGQVIELVGGDTPIPEAIAALVG
ncbi:MAG: SDR family oxidoreductase [Actinobacteria bacterium]|nr:SDR family oxidoreductase [Actinomycetota bacterium]